MILDVNEDWKRVEFEASPAQFFRQGTLVGWCKFGQQLPDGAVPTHVDAAGWDHEHCDLCLAKIGMSGDPFGFVGRHDRWLCAACYAKYASCQNLDFVFGL
jgi:hypothetical protein